LRRTALREKTQVKAKVKAEVEDRKKLMSPGRDVGAKTNYHFVCLVYLVDLVIWSVWSAPFL
jgi:hypothetical protein